MIIDGCRSGSRISGKGPGRAAGQVAFDGGLSVFVALLAETV